MKRALQGCEGPFGRAFWTWAWFAAKQTDDPPPPLPQNKLFRLRTVAKRIHSFIGAASQFNGGQRSVRESNLGCPAWQWYKPLSDWYWYQPMDDFEDCEDAKIQFFDSILDCRQFPKSPTFDHWSDIKETLVSYGLIRSTWSLLWDPTLSFNILDRYPNLVDQMEELGQQSAAGL